MGVVLSGSGIGDHGALENKGVRKYVEGENCGICSRETNMLILYRQKADGGLQ